MAIDNINTTDNLNTGRVKLNQAIDQANTVQGQLDTIIIASGTSDAETIQARGGEPLLYNRLDKVGTQLAENTNEIGEKSTLPLWLTLSLRETSKMHDDYLRQSAINISLPPYNAGGGGDDYDIIVTALSDMNYKGTLYMPGSYKTSKPIHFGKASYDVIDGSAFVVSGLTILGSDKTIIEKTSAALDVSGKNSIIYTNGNNLAFKKINVQGFGMVNSYGYNLRSFSIKSTLADLKISKVGVGYYLDSVWFVSIQNIHAFECFEVVNSSTSEKTSINMGNVWGENVGRFGLLQNLNYCNFGTLLCDWANISTAQGNPYSNPVLLATPISVYEFRLCKACNIANIASEHSNAMSFIDLSACSLNIHTIRTVFFKNNTGTSLQDTNLNNHNPLIFLRGTYGVRKSVIGVIECNEPNDINTVIYNSYPSNTYKSKQEAYLKVLQMPEKYPKAWAENVTSCNSNIMIDYPGGAYPLLWDNTGATPIPYKIKVNSGGTLSSVAVTYHHFV